MRHTRGESTIHATRWLVAFLEKRNGSVVIVRARHVVGIFTAVDALAALSLRLARRE